MAYPKDQNDPQWQEVKKVIRSVLLTDVKKRSDDEYDEAAIQGIVAGTS